MQAVDLANQSPFDVILMDLRMPGLDGVGAARRIRLEDGPNAAAPIIAFSADATIETAVGLFDGLVAKPLTAASLIDGVTRALNWQDAGAIDAAA